MTQPDPTCRSELRGGMVIVAVLIIMVLSAMVAAGMLYRMQAEVAAGAASDAGEQAYAAAMSGIQTAITLFTHDPNAPVTDETTGEEIPYPSALRNTKRSVWHDNRPMFRNHKVYDDGANRWYFTIWSRNYDDKEDVRYGLTDEAGKVNINSIGAEGLAKLPNMTPQLVDALMDFIDQDSEARPEGAEQEYYDQLPKPYLIRNGPLNTIEELLLIKGFTGRIVYGEDANMNTLLDPNEDDGDESFPPDNNDGELDGGLFEVATTATFGPAIDSIGQPQLNLNNPADVQRMADAGFSQQTINYVQARLQANRRFTHPSEMLNDTFTPQGGGGGGGGLPPGGAPGGGGRQRQPQADRGGPATGDVLEIALGPAADGESVASEQVLIEGVFLAQQQPQLPRGQNPFPLQAQPGSGPGRGGPGRGGPGRGGPGGQGGPGGGGQQQPVTSGIGPDDMPLVMDRLTAQPMTQGLLNINSASAAAIATLPDVDAALAQRIVEARNGLDDDTLSTTAWLLTHGVLDEQQYKAIAPRLTARGFQYRIRCIGYGVPSGRYRILEAVIDLSGTEPKIIYMRDVTRLGPPLPLNPEQEEL